MNFSATGKGFVPYESFNKLYESRKLPEFGFLPSPYVNELGTWRFLFCKTEADIPQGFEQNIYDDTEWDIVDVPSSWQMNGYSLPQNLLYDYPTVVKNLSKTHDESARDKYILKSNNCEEDEVGIYRTTVVLSEKDIDRAVYLELEGITGNFEVYFNEQKLLSSGATLTPKRLLLSDVAKVGVNSIAIVVYQFARDNSGHVITENASFGFSGIVRPIRIVLEPLLEMGNVEINTSTAPLGYVSEATSTEVERNDKISKIIRDNYIIKTKFVVTNHTDYMLPYKIKYSLVQVRSEYDPYSMPMVKLVEEHETSNICDSKNTKETSSEILALNVMCWSDATPVLYDLIIELLDSEGNVICAKRKRIGFRSTDIVTGKFNVNDRKVKFNSVKYCEFDPKGGICVPTEVLRQDILLMKCCGVNSVICRNFPPSEIFLNLCDQYGIYVIVLSDKHFISDLVLSSMYHPSVVMWGFSEFTELTNECVDIKNKLKDVDPSRSWYCDNDYSMKVADIKPFPNDAGVIYGPWQDLCIDKAYVMSRNKTGKNIFQTITTRPIYDDDEAPYKWIHHADLVGGKNRDDSSIGQGIVDSERNPHPIFIDIKKQCEMFDIYATHEDPTCLVLRNKNSFMYTEECVLEWKVLLGGNAILAGTGLITEIEPFGMRNLKFPIDIELYKNEGWASDNAQMIALYNEALSHELILDISLKLSKANYYANVGFETAFFQKVLLHEVASPVRSILANEGEKDEGFEEGLSTVEHDEQISKLEVISAPEGTAIMGDNFSVIFDKNNGAMRDLRINGELYFKGGLFPSFYRCPTNIDRTDRSFILAKTVFSKETDYEAIQKSIEYVGSSYGYVNGAYEFVSRYKSFAFKGELLVDYKIYEDSRINVAIHFTPKYDLVRYGFRVPLVKDNLICRWYGLGPGESYADRKLATRIGVYAAGSDKIYHPYARPAENSNHTDTTVLRIEGREGGRLEIRNNDKNSKFDFTVLPYSPEQMNDNLHDEQLIQKEYSELFIDFCTKEIERTNNNMSIQPLKKGTLYYASFDLKII